jgi:8-oxo-dGTP diphosphatase
VCSKLAKIIAKAKMSNEYLAKSYKINDPIPIIEEFSDDKYILRLPYTNIQSFCISTLKEPLLNEEGNKANKQHLLAFESIKSKFLCKKCSADVESIVLAVDCLATKINAKTNAKQILLVTRKKETYHGKLAFPGGRMNYGEMPEAAAIRELKEETGLDGSNPVLFTVEGNPSRDPRGHVVSIVYLMDTDNSKPPVGMDDAETADWYDIDEILKRKDDFAFDHYDIISHYISTIKS